MSQRRVELGILFDHVRRTESQPARVVGASWLYNVEAYRRLFPSSYLATAHAVVRFQHMPLWGQFLDRHGGIREGVAGRFLARLERQSSVHGLEQCFPLPVLRLEAPAQDFYECYGLGS